MIILFGVKFIIKKKKLRIWMFTGLTGVLAGFGGDLGISSEEWPNTTIAKYYGVEKIINSNSEEGILYANNKQSTAP